ncbi:helix-turn-helix transcriptional regulator [Polaromonas sp.]|nr:helix-turn-helix transcriptional regulator [Candidatus Saccharibacteria bacterium]
MTNDLQKKIARRLKTHRENIQLSQLEIANLAGVSSNYYARLERGESMPSAETIVKLAKALKVSSTDILGN